MEAFLTQTRFLEINFHLTTHILIYLMFFPSLSGSETSTSHILYISNASYISLAFRLLTQITTNYLTAWNKVFVDRPRVFQTLKKFPPLHQTERFIIVFTKAR